MLDTWYVIVYLYSLDYVAITIRTVYGSTPLPTCWTTDIDTVHPPNPCSPPFWLALKLKFPTLVLACLLRDFRDLLLA